MALPKQVQAQLEAADAFDKQVAADVAASATGDPPVDPPENPEPPVPTPEPKPQQPEPLKAKPADDEASWKHKFLSLKGMFDSMVPALQQQVKDLTANVKTLSEQQTAKEPPKPPKSTEPLVGKKDVDAFGEDLVDLARRIAREEFGAREDSFKETIAELRTQLEAAKGKVGQIETTTAASARETFFERLGQRLPQWDQVQATEQCQAFLASRIPGARATWNDALVTAAGEMDVDAVMEVFGEFFAKHPEADPKAKPEPTVAPAKRELARQVTPAKSASTPQAPTQKRTYTAREYELESMRIMRFNQQGNYQEAEAIEKELNQALQEGRVR